jgi:hypothetical protein
VLGAMVLVGAATAAVTALLTAQGSSDPVGLRRFAYGTMLYGGLPAWIVMFAGGLWVYHDEFGGKDNPAWIHIGVVTAEGGLVAFLIALFGARTAARRSRRRLDTAAGILAAIALAGWIVAIWAMGAKPD